jgi:hypothetical protein
MPAIKKKNGRSNNFGMVRPRIPAGLYWKVRALAANRGMKPEAYLRQLIEEAVK